ncbi:hypothetical protein DL89DRAFT_294631 [Linderina pennispora]|uniref:Uncharacterized protein n=1 Tax=Linderina pennispora TaxID=61395 RepID=A0A1Y1W1R3_9FUNG|nr:uncharacterized protein DL89DRAFT_294631 [Linderina pennispora]ORX67461.1 hypothetical protein DL89DRAFT_294631 [Linderina pennispora]
MYDQTPDSQRSSLFSALYGIYERACLSAERESRRLFGHASHQSDLPESPMARTDNSGLYQAVRSKRRKMSSGYAGASWLHLNDSDTTLSPIVVSDDENDCGIGALGEMASSPTVSGTNRRRESTLVELEPEDSPQWTPPQMDLRHLERFSEHGMGVLELVSMPPPPAPPPPPQPQFTAPEADAPATRESCRESLVAKQTQTSAAVSEHGSVRSQHAGRTIADSAAVEQARLENVERELRRLKRIIAALLPNGLNEEDLQSVYGGIEQPERTSDDIISRLVKARFGGAVDPQPPHRTPLPMQRQYSFPSAMLPPSPKSSDSAKAGSGALSSPPPSARAAEWPGSGDYCIASSRRHLDFLSRSPSVSSAGPQRRASGTVQRRARQTQYRKPSSIGLKPAASLEDHPEAPHKDPTFMAKLLDEMKTHKLRSVEKPKDMRGYRYRRI